jgi:predicted transcriptional regulator
VSYDSLLDCLSKIAIYRLTEKQKAVLIELNGRLCNSTQLVNYLSKKLNCSKSALWNNLRELREICLIEQNNGKICRLTEIGKIIVSGKMVDEKC